MSLKEKTTYISKLKVRYSEVDRQNIVYNSHYLTYYDISLSEMLDSLFDQEEYIKETNNEFHTVAVQLNFKNPARLNDEVNIFTAIKKIGNSSITFTQEIYRDESDELINEAEIIWVNTNQDEMKPTSIPEDLKNKFSKYLLD
ncbi:acyl-CoA thioesterase [Pelagibacteraceae bacterium]|nr:acyl-CoA thioesterase [Pelagibacteraceae bacterium]